MATKKTNDNKKENYSEKTKERLGNAFKSVDKQMTTATPEEPAEKKAAAETGKENNSKNVKITFFINPSTKDRLKNYCEENDMTLTAGIKKAIREMLKRENNQ